jgi:hypothetical protein
MAAEARLCYYPAPPDAIAGICEHITTNSDKPREVQILDPCCGEGLAIKQIAEHLGIPMANVHCIELDEGRAAKARENLPGAKILGPASFLSTSISPRSFGLVYCNPPFGNELGGGKRDEQAFAEHCVRLLHPKGMLVMVLPINALAGNGRFVCFLDSRLQDIAVYRFPDHCRKYNEIVLIARPRPAAIPEDKLFELGRLHQMGWRYGGHQRPENLPRLGDFQPLAWQNGYPSFDRESEVRLNVLPWSWKPSKFEKSAYTDEELLRVLADSELNDHLRELEVIPPREAPISIGQAHLSMLLGSGELDGTVYYYGPDGKEIKALRHVVRGVTSKKAYFNEEASHVRIDPETDQVHVKHVWSQIINLDLHGFGMDSRLHKWCQGVNAADLEEEEASDWEKRRRQRQAQDAGQQDQGRTTNHGYPEDYDYDLAAQLARMTVANGCTPHEAANAQARLRCMKEGKEFVPEHWAEWIEKFVAQYADQEAAAA